jgi:hypothetical protein
MINTQAEIWQNAKHTPVSKAKSNGDGHLPANSLGRTLKHTRLKAGKK